MFVAALSVNGDVISGSEDVGCSVRELEVSTVEVFLTACSPFEKYFRGVIDKWVDFVRCVVFFVPLCDDVVPCLTDDKNDLGSDRHDVDNGNENEDTDGDGDEKEGDDLNDVEDDNGNHEDVEKDEDDDANNDDDNTDGVNCNDKNDADDDDNADDDNNDNDDVDVDDGNDNDDVDNVDDDDDVNENDDVTDNDVDGDIGDDNGCNDDEGDDDDDDDDDDADDDANDDVGGDDDADDDANDDVGDDDDDDDESDDDANDDVGDDDGDDDDDVNNGDFDDDDDGCIVECDDDNDDDDVNDDKADDDDDKDGDDLNSLLCWTEEETSSCDAAFDCLVASDLCPGNVCVNTDHDDIKDKDDEEDGNWEIRWIEVEVGGVEADFDCWATAVDSRSESNEEFDSNDEDDGENSEDHDDDDDNDKYDDNIDDNDDDNDGGDDVDEDDDDSNDVDGDDDGDDNDDTDEDNVVKDDNVDDTDSLIRWAKLLVTPVGFELNASFMPTTEVLSVDRVEERLSREIVGLKLGPLSVSFLCNCRVWKTGDDTKNFVDTFSDSVFSLSKLEVWISNAEVLSFWETDNDLSDIRCCSVTCAVLLTFMLGVAEIALSVSDVSMDFSATDDVISKSNNVISPFVCDVAWSGLLIRDALRAFIPKASVVENAGLDSDVDFNIDMSVSFDVISVKNVIFEFVYHDVMPAFASMDLGSDTISWACGVEMIGLDATVTSSIGVSVLDVIFL